MSARAERRGILAPVLAIALAGLALRVLYVLALSTRPSGFGDAQELHGLANVIADGHGFVNPFVAHGAATAHKPPLYPLLLAGVSLLGGRSYEAHQLATGVIGAITVVLVALIAARLAGRRAGLAAAALTAAYPVFLTTDASLHTETLYTALVAFVILSALRARERPSGPRLATLGAAVGLAALTRSEGVLLVLVALPVAWPAGGWARRGGRFGVVLLAGAVVLAPWLVRCWIVFDRPVAITTSSGDLVAGANCPSTYGGSLIGEWQFGCVLGEHGANEAIVADRLRARGLRYAREHVPRLPAVLVARGLRPWGLFHPAQEIELQASAGAGPRWAGWAGLLSAWLLMALALTGAVMLRRRRAPPGWGPLLLAPVLLVLVVSVTGYGILRFRAPADVTLLVLAAVALDALLRRPRARHG